MKEKEKNPDFEYELSCDQMCGDAHYTMRGIIHVVTQQEFDLWMAKQEPNYVAVQKAEHPAPATKAAADSTGNKPTAQVVAPATNKH